MDSFEAHFRAAAQQHAAGKYQDAVQVYAQLYNINAQHRGVVLNLASAYRSLKQYQESAALLNKHAAPFRHDPQYWYQRALLHKDTGQGSKAIADLERATSLAPDVFQYWMRLATERQAIGYPAGAALAQAFQCYRQVPQLSETALAELYNALGGVLHSQGDHYLAQNLYLACARLNPAFAGAWHNAGLAAAKMGHHKIAKGFMAQALARNPTSAVMQSAVGQAHISLGEFESGLEYAQKAYDQNPSYLDAQFALARGQFLSGAWQDAWQTYESRWQRTNPDKSPKDKSKAWQGQAGENINILVYAEQGNGDVIQFLRYIPKLAAKVGRVYMCCQKQMVPLAKTVPGVYDAAHTTEGFPELHHHVALLSLPRFLEPVTPFFDQPYLFPDDMGLRIAKPSGIVRQIGVVWAGSPTHENDKLRSVTLEDLYPLMGHPENKFYSFQLGAARGRDHAPLQGNALVHDLGPYLESYSHTATLLRQMDLVIAVDTSVCHLAAALNIPTWVMLPKSPDWRWGYAGRTTGWYPSMRLYRQQTGGIWQDVVAEMADDLLKVQYGQALSDRL
jgi:tetratricopeptide (TPR) repeat protein